MSKGTYIVTFAEGKWSPFADQIVENFREVSGLPVIRIRDDREDYKLWYKWMKCCIWDHVPDDCERIIWLDADIVLLQPFPQLPEGDWCAVLDWPGTFHHAKEQWPSLRSVTQYFNAGVFVITRKTQPLFEHMKTQAPVTADQYGHHKDQGWLNRELSKERWREELDIVELPQKWNWLLKVWGPPPNDSILVHLAGMGSGPLDRFGIMRAMHLAGSYKLEAINQLEEVGV